MQLPNRVFYDVPTGIIIHQTGEHVGEHLCPYPEVTEIAYLDLSFGEIDFNTHYVERIDAEGKPVIKEYAKELTSVEIENAKLKEDIILLQTDSEVGGIL